MWIRFFEMRNGLLISHRDFIEFDRAYTRLQIPLRTDQSCLHSEEASVFHLRQGEIWYLEATAVHAACSLGNFNRIALCLDFDLAGMPLTSILRRRTAAPCPPPLLIERPPLGNDGREALLALSGIADRVNIREIAGLFGRVHFYRQAHAADCFDWLVALTARAGDQALLEKAVAFRRYCIERRVPGSHFQW
jgi:hypothetical protein